MNLPGVWKSVVCLSNEEGVDLHFSVQRDQCLSPKMAAGSWQEWIGFKTQRQLLERRCVEQKSLDNIEGEKLG